MIGATWCPFCVKVKNYLDSTGYKYQWIDSDTPEGQKIRDAESAKHKYKTIPMVFIDGKFIGGCNEFFNKKGREVKL